MTSTKEYGDFQTPEKLAKEIAVIVNSSLPKIDTIIEPTCGTGSFIKAFTEIETSAKKVIGWEINSQYVEIAKQHISRIDETLSISIKQQNFFDIDWSQIKSEMNNSLFIGNPPWVTNSDLGKYLSSNTPQKINFQNLSGLEAMTGKSNFDISEWILIQICQQISRTTSAMAFLVKTSVARKIYQYIANNKLSISSIQIREIDAKKHFDVNVDACLFVAKGSKTNINRYVCDIYTSLHNSTPQRTIGLRGGKLISDINTYTKLADIDSGCELKWRSGVKHDASKIMEFTITEQGLTNGFGETVDISDNYLYPMYKSSDIAQPVLSPPRKKMLVTQHKIGEDTNLIRDISPDTWNYLTTNSNKLDSRKSSIYKNAPRFAIFGVGDYTFRPWKIVISSLYKNIKFSKIGCFDNKPIILDDTCYMLGFDSEEEADLILTVLTSDIASKFIDSIIFKDNKRAVTATILNRISLRPIAVRLGVDESFDSLFSKDKDQQLLLRT